MYVRMARISPLVSLSADDLAQVVRWEAAPSTPQQVALRCRLVLAAASGKQDLEIASTYDVNRHTAALWRQRVRAAGIGSLWEIQPGRGRKPKYDQEKRDALIAATLETKPKGMTHWSCRTLAKAQGVSHSTVNRLWQLHNLKPHLSRTFKLSRDPSTPAIDHPRCEQSRQPEDLPDRRERTRRQEAKKKEEGDSTPVYHGRFPVNEPRHEQKGHETISDGRPGNRRIDNRHR